MATAAATTPKLTGTYGDWSAYTLGEGKARSCYIVTRPKSSTPKLDKRGEVSILVSRQQGDKTSGQINVNAGYDFKKSAKAELVIDKTGFNLVTFDKPGYRQSAFAEEGKDAAIIAALEKGKGAVVKGTPEKGASVTDTYALAGATAALKAIAAECK